VRNKRRYESPINGAFLNQSFSLPRRKRLSYAKEFKLEHHRVLSLADGKNIIGPPDTQCRHATAMILKRQFLLPTLSLALLFIAGSSTFAQTMQSPLPKPNGYVNDYAAVIDSATKDRMELTLGNLDREQQIQFAVVTVNTTGGQEMFDYSLAVARGWGIGSKDTSKPSLLLLVAIKDRKYYTQVSRHLEGELPDGLVGQIQREQLVPAFRAQDYGKGLSDTVNVYISTLAAKRGFSTDKIFAPGETVRRRGSSGSVSSWLSPVIVFSTIAIILIVMFLIRGGGGRGGRGGGQGWLALLLLNMFMNSGRGSGSGSSGWSGGGFGGDSGGGGFGGFGGGGDFGGGGAGGSW
jgi:uncharacterized protein